MKSLGEIIGGFMAVVVLLVSATHAETITGPAATPYALGIDAKDNIWYSSHDLDVVGRLDPRTGKVTEYPIPYPENYFKEFFLDDQGRMWFGSPPNNKVGYFILPE